MWEPAHDPRSRRDRLRGHLDDVLDATGTGARAAIAGVALLGVLAGSLWWLSRQAPAPVESTIPLVEVAALTTTTAEPADVVVHVAGAVVAPGVYELEPGTRVIDAVTAAGGVTPDADLDRVNLAAPVVDGARIYIPRIGEAVVEAVGSGGTTSAGPVDLNTASADELDALPGIGPATAAAIIEHRDRHGPFRSVEDLLDVPGIGEAKLAALRDLVAV